MNLFSRIIWSAGMRLGNIAGISAPELTMAISAASIVGTMASPTVTNFLNDAKLAKARNDVKAIRVAMLNLVEDVKVQKSVAQGWNKYDLLVGNGETPEVGSDGGAEWAAAADGKVGSLDEHLMNNTPAYPRAGAGPTLGRPGWRGPYLEDRVGPDPWGNRYAINVKVLAASGQADAIVLSAGPNGVIETPFEIDGILAGGDDILALVSSGR